MAVLFPVTKTQTQPRCPSSDGWVNKIQYTFKMELRSATNSQQQQQQKTNPINYSYMEQTEGHYIKRYIRYIHTNTSYFMCRS